MEDNEPHTTPAAQPEPTPPGKQSIGELISKITDQFSRLMRAEVAAVKSELKSKATKSAMAIGMFVAAGVLALYGLGFLLWAGVTAIALALPLWLSALIMAVALFIIVAILALVGKKLLDKNSPPMPTEAIASIKQDVATIKGGLK